MGIGDAYVIKQPFVLTSVDHDFDNMHADGILGLGFKLLSDGYPVFVESLKTQGEISEAIFSVYMSDDDYQANIPTHPESNIIIGGYDLEKYAKGKNFTFVDVIDHQGYWGVELTKIKSGTSALTTAEYKQNAIIDTGTSLMVGPARET